MIRAYIGACLFKSAHLGGKSFLWADVPSQVWAQVPILAPAGSQLPAINLAPGASWLRRASLVSPGPSLSPEETGVKAYGREIGPSVLWPLAPSFSRSCLRRTASLLTRVSETGERFPLPSHSCVQRSPLFPLCLAYPLASHFFRARHSVLPRPATLTWLGLIAPPNLRDSGWEGTSTIPAGLWLLPLLQTLDLLSEGRHPVVYFLSLGLEIGRGCSQLPGMVFQLIGIVHECVNNRL